jgi:putative hydrolase of the HAD superfamily
MIRAVIFDFYGVLNNEMLPNQELIKFIKTKLKSKYKLGILSNAVDDFMYEIIGEEELRKIFDEIVISHQVGIAKPEPAVYQIALKKLNVRAKESVFIDDTETHCEGARSLGMQSIQYKNFEQMQQELEKILTGSDS